MKKAEWYENKYANTVYSIADVIRIAQKDAIKETVKECAKSAKTRIDPNSYCGNTGSEYPPDIIVDTQSILSVGDKLIKEL